MAVQKTMDKDKKYYITNAEPMMYIIKPYGYTEKGENGEIKSFSLVGFTIGH